MTTINQASRIQKRQGKTLEKIGELKSEINSITRSILKMEGRLDWLNRRLEKHLEAAAETESVLKALGINHRTTGFVVDDDGHIIPPPSTTES